MANDIFSTKIIDGEIKFDKEEILDGDLHCIDMYYYSKDLKKNNPNK